MARAIFGMRARRRAADLTGDTPQGERHEIQTQHTLWFRPPRLDDRHRVRDRLVESIAPECGRLRDASRRSNVPKAWPKSGDPGHPAPKDYRGLTPRLLSAFYGAKY